MKKKFIVIGALMLLLGYTIYQMMQYEQSIREDHIITKYIEDDTKPILERLNNKDLQDIVADVSLRFKAGKQYFQTQIKTEGDEKWQPVFLKGVNIGLAVPGHFPAEFSFTFEQYLDWFDKIGEMNSNVIRTYTILPPDFYKALAYHNLHHSDHPLYLLQGVWATIPEDENYYNPAYMRKFKREIADVVDVIHGKAVLKPQRGKAHGVYATDISEYLMGYLLGREWEPKAVFKTIISSKENDYNGAFVSVPKGNPMEIWLAKMMDFSIRYETQTYYDQHPVSFVNWLPLDPMYHNSEYIENKKVREYDNDLSQVDFAKFNTTNLYKAGIFASYHVYPYYPDYIYLDKKYATAVNAKQKKDNFYAYLQDLKQHTPGMPLVIAEYGLPTSRGISHYSPDGLHQGGHSEAAQAELSLMLTQDIVDTGCAGAVYFEWADEWFKHNWLVMDFEIPFHDRKYWHNMENPEQNFGIVASEDRRKTIDGNLEDWQKDEAVYAENDKRIYAFADATYFYTAADLPQIDFAKNNLYIAIDTYDAEKGDKKLPFSDKIFDNGFEFLVAIKSPDEAKILVDEPYSVFTDIYNDHIPVYASRPNQNGKFINQLMLTNRSRETLTGEKTDSIIINRSPLVMAKSNQAETSNADWYWNAENQQFELRLDWHLLNVSDPAKKYVLDDKSDTKQIEASQTDGFRFFYFITDKKDHLLQQIPDNEPMFFTWDNWDMPVYTERKKPLYDTLKNYFALLTVQDTATENIARKDRFEIADFYENRPGAISVTFENFSFSQYEYAYPLLNKYQLNADFAIQRDLMHNMPVKIDLGEGHLMKRMGYLQLKEILQKGNEVALQTGSANLKSIDLSIDGVNKQAKAIFTDKNGIEKYYRKDIFIKNNKPHQNTYQGVSYDNVKSGLSTKLMDSILKNNRHKWSVLTYHHIYKDSMEVSNVSKDILPTYFLDFDTFRKQIRLARNTGNWIAPVSKVYKYLYEKKHSKISVRKLNNTIFLTINNNLNINQFDQALTIVFYTSARKVKITNSETDGIFDNKTGMIVFDVLPNNPVRIEILENNAPLHN